MSAPIGAQVPTLWQVYDAWLRRAGEVITDSADALNAMNVFPVSDSDTGSNIRLTLSGIAQAVPDINRASLDAVVQAAILSAHGNSGAILAEMFASVCRALEQQQTRLGPAPPGAMVAQLLGTAANAARRAVARPVAGTILTVADATADAAEDVVGEHLDDPLAVAESAQRGAHEALARTPDQLAVLAEAGVVDAGGQAFTLLVDVLVEVLGGAPARPLVAPTAADQPRGNRSAADQEYEVMYTLRDSAPDDLDALREELSALGHSVVIVGDRAVAQVHVHLAEAGTAIEAGLGKGRLSQIRITALPPEEMGQASRTVLSVVAGAGLAEAVSSFGGTPLLVPDRSELVGALTAAAEQTHGDLVVLPNDMETLEVARHLATELRRHGRRVAVIPTVAQVQGLAAMAVHEPTADFDSVVITMSSAAGHARHGAVTIAESPAMTMAGRCEAGDVLGAVEGDFTEIGDEAGEVAWRVVQRLLSTGGELVTVIAGAGAEPSVVEGLTRRVLAEGRGLDVEVVDGGQARYLMLLGVE